METNNELKEIGIYLFNKIGAIYKEKEEISSKVYEVLAYNKRLPARVYDIISDPRYHKEFHIFYGFKWYLRGLKEPPFFIYYGFLMEIASKLKIPFIAHYHYADLLLYTLLIEYFEENKASA